MFVLFHRLHFVVCCVHFLYDMLASMTFVSEEWQETIKTKTYTNGRNIVVTTLHIQCVGLFFQLINVVFGCNTHL